MSRSVTAVPSARPPVACRPATRPRPMRYADVVGRVVAGGLPAGREVAPMRAASHQVRATASGASPRRRARLTSRGRAVVILLVAIVLTVAFSLGRASSGAAPDAGPRAPRPTVVVQPGDNLWRIATRIAPDADPRETVRRIAELNDLGTSPTVRAGQQLVVPG